MWERAFGKRYFERTYDGGGWFPSVADWDHGKPKVRSKRGPDCSRLDPLKNSPRYERRGLWVIYDGQGESVSRPVIRCLTTNHLQILASASLELKHEGYSWIGLDYGHYPACCAYDTPSSAGTELQVLILYTSTSAVYTGCHECLALKYAPSR